jgi:aromatic ring-cleaving dioxygenase
MKTIETDVLVCGGGCAGIGAALASARNNVKTMLVERAGFSGGIITAVGLPYFDGVADKKTGRIVVGGIPFEMLVKLGRFGLQDRFIKPHNPKIASTEQFKIQADEWLMKHHDILKVLYHSQACDVVTNNHRITSVKIANKDGLVEVKAKQFIDATGDADIACWSGTPTEKTTPLMPMTLHFRIGNVRRSPEISKLTRKAFVKAQEDGLLKMFYGPGLIFHFAEDEAYFHAVRVPGDATDASDLTRSEIQGRKDAWAMFEICKKYVPGFEKSYFITCGPYIGVRETRRLVGKYVLTEQDIRTGRRFDDAIATGCWYADRHPNYTTVGSANDPGTGFQPDPYDIPYRSLVSKDIENLLVAGRCHSASAWAASSTRVTVTAMAMGQAAGTAAAIAVKKKTSSLELSGIEVRKELESQGAGPFTDA